MTRLKLNVCQKLTIRWQYFTIKINKSNECNLIHTVKYLERMESFKTIGNI